MHYYILALSKNRAKLYEVRDATAVPHPVNGMPGSLDDAWKGLERHDQNLQFHSGSGGGGNAVFHGQGGAKDIEKEEVERYVHMVAHSLQKMLKEGGLPLIFAGVEEECGMFRKHDDSGMLLHDFIHGNPDQLKPEELREKAEPIVREYLLAEHAKHLEAYGNLLGTGRTSVDPAEILTAAHAGKVEVLFMVEGAEHWGTFNAEKGETVMHGTKEDGDENLIDSAVHHVRQHRGRVYSVEKGGIPDAETATMAAILRL